MPILAGPDPIAGGLAGPCAPWDPIWCCTLPTGADAVTGYAIQAATEVMWAASAQRFGLCASTLRPCRRECASGWQSLAWPGYGRWPQPMFTERGWINLTCGACTGGCSCTTLEEALLPAPVYDVITVMLDGLVMPNTSYRIDNNRLLVRVDGGRWPVCQNLAVDDTHPNTWSVTARFGEPVPVLGRQAVGELACEMVKACMGADCRLPANIQSLARQGVSLQFPSARDKHTLQEFAERGYFGGLFIQTYNPQHLQGRPVVYDVDGPSFRRTGT
jgi:hypothetical protein